MPEVIPIGADHAGVDLKARLVHELRSLGYEPLDLGTTGTESVDYPDFAHAVAGQVERQDARRGVLLCGTGLGMSYAANRHPGVRAAVAWSPEIARLAREHNDANVLSIGGRMHSQDEAVKFVEIFLATPYTHEERHQRRIDMLTEYETTGELPPIPAHHPQQD